MSIEDYKRQRDAMEVPSHGNLFPVRELLEQLLDTVVRLDREASFGGGYGHRVGEIGGHRNGYRPEGLPNTSGSLNSLASKVSGSVDTPLYPETMNRGQRSSCGEAIGCNLRYDDLSWNYKVSPLTLRKDPN